MQEEGLLQRQCAIEFKVKRASNSAFKHSAKCLESYSKSTSWQSFSHRTEQITLELEYKSLVSGVRILNKNASCVSVSVAVDNSSASDYLKISDTATRLPHYRESTIKTGYFPCRFIKLTFPGGEKNPSLEVFGVRIVGIPCHYIEADGGRSMRNVLSDSTEKLLYGASLKASLPSQDCLSTTVSGSSEWMLEKQKSAEKRLQRLEKSVEMYHDNGSNSIIDSLNNASSESLWSY